MTPSDCLIAQGDGDWQIHFAEQSVFLNADASPAEICDAVADLANAVKAPSVRCVLAPNSDECFFTRLDLDSDIDAKDHNAMLFLLEGHLPLDAESIVADLVPCSRVRTDRGR